MALAGQGMTAEEYFVATDGDPRTFEAVPAIVIEVRSPSTWSYDRGVKLRRYERDGAREVWLVDTASDTVLVHRRSAGATTFDEVLELGAGDPLTSPLLPDFAVDVRDLFDR